MKQVRSEEVLRCYSTAVRCVCIKDDPITLPRGGRVCVCVYSMCSVCVCAVKLICPSALLSMQTGERPQNHEAQSVSSSGSLLFQPASLFSHLSVFVCTYLHSVYTLVITPRYKNVTQDKRDGAVFTCESCFNDFGQGTGAFKTRTRNGGKCANKSYIILN